MMIKVEKSNSVLGATISGFDLSKPFSDDEVSNFMQVLSENEVVFIRDQDISYEDHKRLAEYLSRRGSGPSFKKERMVSGICIFYLLSNT